MRFGKRRRTTSESKVEIQMTPMLDMIFQLLVFFILTFKPVTDEGQFDITMSTLARGNLASPGTAPAFHEAVTQVPIQVTLRAAADGSRSLAANGIIIGERAFPTMGSLEAELRSIVGGTADDFSVVIEADAGLQYQYVMLAVNAVSHAGIQNINFSTTLE